MQHGLWLRAGDSTDAAELVDAAVAAEAAGWDGVFVSDTLSTAAYPDPWVLLAAMAARTTDLALGTWVVPVPRRQPWQVAKAVATLDRLSGGRMLLGAGLGTARDYEPFGRPYEPPELARRFDEALDVIDGLWRGEPFDYDGEHFTLEGATVEPTPVQEPRVPILLGCWWPNRAPFRRGARWDGILPYWPALTEEGVGEQGEQATGTPEEELRDMMAYYRDVADDPGEVVLPTLPDVPVGDYLDTYEALGATWLLTSDVVPGSDHADRRVRDGPPG